MTYRASIAERIAWTRGLKSAEGKVLIALWSSGDYGTGRHCRPSVSTIVARSGLSRATVTRTLARLRAAGWIRPTARRHRQATAYDIQVDRLATEPPAAQQMSMDSVVNLPRLEAQNEPLKILEAQNEPLNPVLEAQNEPPPVRTTTTTTSDGLRLIGETPPPRCAHPQAHAWCEGRVHVPRDLHFELLDNCLGTRPGESRAAKAARLVAFYAATMAALPASRSVAPDEAHRFWKTAFTAWVSGDAQAPAGPPRVSATPGRIAGSVCPHDPVCASYAVCRERALEDYRFEQRRRHIRL